MLLLFFNLYSFLTLQYCIGFAIHQHESATGIHICLYCPILALSIFGLETLKTKTKKPDLSKQKGTNLIPCVFVLSAT